MFALLEELMVRGSDKPQCEDGYFVREDEDMACFAVFDGATAMDDDLKLMQLHGRQLMGGAWVVNVLCRFFQSVEDTIGWDAITDARTALRLADDELLRAFDEHYPGYPAWRRPAAAAFIVVIRGTKLTWAQVADCIGAVELNGARGSRWAFADDQPLRELDTSTYKRMRELGVSSTKHPEIRAMLEEQFRGRNKPGSYSMLDGNLNLDLVRHGELDARSVQHLALFTDGFFFFNTPEILTVASEIFDQGLVSTLQAVWSAEDRDRERVVHHRTRQSDDKVGLLIERR